MMLYQSFKLYSTEGDLGGWGVPKLYNQLISSFKKSDYTTPPPQLKNYSSVTIFLVYPVSPLPGLAQPYAAKHIVS
jgi:hypothetical protein